MRGGAVVGAIGAEIGRHSLIGIGGEEAAPKKAQAREIKDADAAGQAELHAHEPVRHFEIGKEHEIRTHPIEEILDRGLHEFIDFLQRYLMTLTERLAAAFFGRAEAGAVGCCQVAISPRGSARPLPRATCCLIEATPCLVCLIWLL